jgi:hypothetical protein
LLGIKFTAKNAYWDNELKGYVDIILFRLFDHLDIIKCDCKNKNVSLFASPDGHLKIPHLWPGQNPPPRWSAERV